MLYIIKNYHLDRAKRIIDLLAGKGIAFLFIGEAVFYLLAIQEIIDSKTTLFALKDSIQLFGLTEKIPIHVKWVDYAEWVELTEKHAIIITL